MSLTRSLLTRFAPAIALCLALTAVAHAFTCPAPLPAVTDIQAQGFYTEQNGSVVDEKRWQENRAALKPLNDFNRQFLEMADRFAEHHDDEARQCALGWLSSWAQQSALIGKMTPQGQYQRTLTLGAISLGLIKLGMRPNDLSPQIRSWLITVANAMVSYMTRRTDKNNIYYWAGAAAAATSIVTGDMALWRFASHVYDVAMDAIGDDGTLPYELKRRGRATGYHSFAAGPLVLMGRLSRPQGEDWFTRKNGRIHLLTGVVFRAVDNPQLLRDRAGAEQAPITSLPWLPLYNSAFPDRVTKSAKAVKARPWYQFLGGNVFVLDNQLK
jgi:poly(beta-D-mannuronate) lyase